MRVSSLSTPRLDEHVGRIKMEPEISLFCEEDPIPFREMTREALSGFGQCRHPKGIRKATMRAEGEFPQIAGTIHR